ncbi:MAG: Fur family transcriptional regulator [Candidatus Aminicenantia bacterium]
MKKEYDKFKNYLTSQNLKLTEGRKAVFEEIFSSRQIHLDAEDIYERLKKKNIRISRATIYRTLNLLVKSGLVSEISFGETHSHYEPEVPKERHGHLVCLGCGQVIEFNSPEIVSIIDEIGRENKFHLDKFSIQTFGYCQKCSHEYTRKKQMTDDI